LTEFLDRSSSIYDEGAPAVADAPKLYPYVPLDQSGQLDGQLIQIGDVQERITVLDTVILQVIIAGRYYKILFNP
jgi:hypothetical protein